MKAFLNLALPVLLAGLFGVSCSSGKTEDFSAWQGTKSNFEPVVFPPIKDCKISLEIISTRCDFYAGEEAQLTLRLKNIGQKQLVVYEWMLNEPDNIRLSYAPSAAPGLSPAEEKWKHEEPLLEHPVKRTPMTLNPGNSAVISVPMKFIAAMEAKDVAGGSRHYMVFCELNLKSITARTAPFPISVK